MVYTSKLPILSVTADMVFVAEFLSDLLKLIPEEISIFSSYSKLREYEIPLSSDLKPKEFCPLRGMFMLK